MQKTLWQKFFTGLLMGAIATTVVTVFTLFFWPRLFEAFEAQSLDWRYFQRLAYLWEERRGNVIDEIIIVDIDNRSLEKLGQFNRWPRSYHAQLIRNLSSAGALAIGFDILFMEPDASDFSDDSLITETRRAGNVFHSMAFSNADPDAFLYPMDAPVENLLGDFSFKFNASATHGFKSAERMDGRLVELYNAAAGIGFANFSPDHDSVIRTMPMFLNFAGRQYPSLSLTMVMGLFGVDSTRIEIIPGKAVNLSPPGAENRQIFRIPIDRQGRMLINYQGTFQTFRYVSYYDALMQRIPPEAFEGRVVLIGTSAAGLSDIRPVPFQDAFPGVEVHANIIHNILSQEFITKQNQIHAILSILLLAVLIAALAMMLRPWQSGAFSLLLAGGYVILAFVFFSRQAYWLEIVRPVLAILFTYLIVFVYRYIDEERNKKFIKNMFQYYLSTPVVEELLKRPEMLKLGGDRRIATAFFSDIKDFTTVSEKLSPEDLVSQLNEYLSAMTRIVLKYEGYLDKYEGDAIMAIFGVPVEQPDHAKRACLAALDMMTELTKLRGRWQAQGKPEFHARMGINSGPMIAGNIGGTDRFDYTVIGDAVNLASRLEGANKMYGTQLMISEFTKEFLDDEIALREIDFIRVKGKTKPVRVYEVMASSRAKLNNAQLLLLQEFNIGLEYYRKQKWSHAIQAFQRALVVMPEDGPSQTFLERCQFYQKNPVPRDWDGVFEMRSK